jgi:predicted dehydrogenase
MKSDKDLKLAMDRRQFLRSSAAVGAGLVFAPRTFAAAKPSKSDQINVAVIGVGRHGMSLLKNCLKLGKDYGVRVKAICDIWEAVSIKKAAKVLDAYEEKYKTYIDYKEMLDKEKDLDAVIIGTPLFCHSQQTVDCLKAGLHVYCEKEMSNTIEGARQMVQASRQTGKLLQIGRQRRSNVEYIHSVEKLLKEAKLLGRITTVNGQWNRSVRPDRGYPKKYAIEPGILKKYGYKSMEHFVNWRWYKGLGCGYLIELGSHQIDVFNWFLGATPRSVVVSGGTEYFDKKNHQWPDQVMAVLEYETGDGVVRAFYQMIITNGSQRYFEKFMGTEGTLLISLSSRVESNVYREGWVAAEKWDKWVKKGYLKQAGAAAHTEADDESLDVRPSAPPTTYNLGVTKGGSNLRPHLINFFDSIRGKAKLTCPSEVAYKAAVVILKANEAAVTGERVEFKPEDFIV